MTRSLPALSLMLWAVSTSSAQPPSPSDTSQQAQAAAGPERPGFTPPPEDPKPYEKVITKDATSKKGVFTVHQIKDKYYYEIPYSEFEEQFLWNTQIAKTT